MRRSIVRTLACGLAAGLLTVPIGQSAASAKPVGAPDRSVPVSRVPVKPQEPPRLEQHRAKPPVWPSSGSADVSLTAGTATADLGGLPVRVSSGQAARVKLDVLDRAASQKAGAHLLVRVSALDASGASVASKVRVEVSYDTFRDAYGGAYAARLQLMAVPRCGLELSDGAAPDVRMACAARPLPTDNAYKNGTVAADVDLSLPDLGLRTMAGRSASDATVETLAAGTTMVALASSPTAPGVGTFAKTDLKASSTWLTGPATGDFGYSYPVTVPQVPGGLTPKPSFNYSSSAVDGQTAAEHVQPGVLGEGWRLGGGGFIESTFRPCALDKDAAHAGLRWPVNTADPCVRLENYQLSWGGESGELVPTADPAVWEIASDQGSKVERLIGPTGWPSWRLTTKDGTRYHFGLERLPGWEAGLPETASTLGQEVFANHDGEPCVSTVSFLGSRCWTIYRWNLDYVVDIDGNSMSYWYQREANLTGLAGSATTVTGYHRDAQLARIDYGTRAGRELFDPAPAQVQFELTDRCVTDCGNLANWMDTPFDLACSAAPCTNNVAPSYWTTKRLSKVRTRIRSGSGYRAVDEWAIAHQFPGGTDVPVLWLASITRTGFDAAGAGTAMPPLYAYGQRDRNRADYDPNANMADAQKYRINRILTETGRRIDVTYAPHDTACNWWVGKSAAEWPNYNHNASKCFMQWVTNRSGSSGWSWWYKFVVRKVTDTDTVGGSPPVETSYEYKMDGAASNHPLVLWSYATGVWGTPKKAMSTWRGYPTVITTVGAAGGTQSKTMRRYYRGLDRDTGLDPAQEFWRQASVTDSQGVAHTDHIALAGRLLTEIVYDGAAEVSKTDHVHSAPQTAGGDLPAWQTPPERKAYMAQENATHTFTKVASGWRENRVDRIYDLTYATLSRIEDKGDVSTAADDLCTRYTYHRNTVRDILIHPGGGNATITGSPRMYGFIGGTPGMLQSFPASFDKIFSPGDFDGDGQKDVIARNLGTAELVLYGTRVGKKVLGGGWTSAYDQIFSAGDHNGDGKADVMARFTGTWEVYLYPGDGNGNLGTAYMAGNGWTNVYDTITGVPDFDGDGKADILTRRADSNVLALYGTLGVKVLANGWNNIYDRIFSPGDLTGDGKPDVVTRRGASLFVHPGNGGNPLGAPVLLTGTAAGHTADVFFGHGDWTGDGKVDILSRQANDGFITGTVTRAETLGVNCATTAAYPTDLVSDTRYLYDSGPQGRRPVVGHVTATEQVKSHNGFSPTYFTAERAEFDPFGRPVWTENGEAERQSTTYTHNAAGLLEKEETVNPAGHRTTVNLDPARSTPTSIVDPNGKATTTEHDRLGRLTKVWRPGNTTGIPDVEYGYSVTGTAPPHVVTKALGPNNNRIISYDIYDALLRPRQQQTTAPDGKRTITDTGYDSRGLVSQVTTFYNSASPPSADLAGFTNGSVDRQQRFVHDGAGRRSAVDLWSRDALHHRTAIVHGGDSIGVIPPAGGTVTQDMLDGRGRVTETRLYHGAGLTGGYDRVLFTYDDADRVRTVKDAAGQQWSYEYDLSGNRRKTTDPDTGETTATFDNAGRVLSTMDARSQQLFFDYDALGRKTWERADSTTGPLLASWTYDTVAKGYLTSATRHHGTDTYTLSIGSYDDGYRPRSQTLTAPGFGVASYAVEHTYKANGAPATRTAPGVGGLPDEEFVYEYADSGVRARLTSDEGIYIDGTGYAYDGLVSELSLGASGKHVRVGNAYDLATRRLLTRQTDTETAAAGVYANRFSDSYTYDLAGNVTSAASTRDAVADQEECFRYDQLRRLKEAWTQVSGACTTPQRSGADPYWRAWSYDATGNRETQTDKNADGTTATQWTYTTGAAGGVKPHQVKEVTAAGLPTRTFAYDAAGNMTQRTTPEGGTQILAWDREGRLAGVTEGAAGFTYVYDADGKRLVSAGPTKSTLYLPDGTELEKMASGGAVLGRRYVDGVAVRDATGLKWTVTDHNGTATAQIDQASLEVNRRRLMPFGEQRGAQPAWAGDKGFVDGIKEATGLTQLGARAYDPTLGRFVSRDPVMRLQDSQAWHGYSYSGNSPVTFSDPTGLHRPVEPGGPPAPPSPPPPPPPPPPVPPAPHCQGGNESASCDPGPEPESPPNPFEELEDPETQPEEDPYIPPAPTREMILSGDTEAVLWYCQYWVEWCISVIQQAADNYQSGEGSNCELFEGCGGGGGGGGGPITVDYSGLQALLEDLYRLRAEQAEEGGGDEFDEDDL